jgi:hypothetical protein
LWGGLEFFNVLLKFFCNVSSGEAQKPKDVRHFASVCANCVLTVWWVVGNRSCVFSNLLAERLCLRCAIRHEELPSFCLD